MFADKKLNHHVAPSIRNEGNCAVGVMLRHLLVFPSVVIEIELDLHVEYKK